MGKNIEHYHRTIAFDALLGGGAFCTLRGLYFLTRFGFALQSAEDVLADLGVRQAMRSMPKNARL